MGEIFPGCSHYSHATLQLQQCSPPYKWSCWARGSPSLSSFRPAPKHFTLTSTHTELHFPLCLLLTSWEGEKLRKEQTKDPLEAAQLCKPGGLTSWIRVGTKEEELWTPSSQQWNYGLEERKGAKRAGQLTVVKMHGWEKSPVCFIRKYIIFPQEDFIDYQDFLKIQQWEVTISTNPAIGSDKIQKTSRNEFLTHFFSLRNLSLWKTLMTSLIRLGASSIFDAKWTQAIDTCWKKRDR